jgi:hypothetical protein
VIAEYRHAISLLKAFLKREYCGQEKEYKKIIQKNLRLKIFTETGSFFCMGTADLLIHSKKKVIDFLVPSRDVTNQTLPGR